MLCTVFGITVTYFLCSVRGSPMIDSGDREGLKYEEYLIEHEISSAQAKNAVLAIDLRRVNTPPGCQECNEAEIKYCLGGDLINDHCCCDRRYHEVFPFIPHTCYWGTTQCKPVVGDCSKYDRLRRCCCHKYALQKWKDKSSGCVINSSRVLCLTLLFLFPIVNM